MNTSGFKAYLQSEQYSPKTIAGHLRMLTFFSAWLQKEQLQPEALRYSDLLGYIQHLKKKERKAATLRTYLNTVRLFYNSLQEQGHITHHPMPKVQLKGVSGKKLYVVLDTSELHALYSAAPPADRQVGASAKGDGSAADHQISRNRAVVGLFVYQGVSSEELQNLPVTAVNLRAGTVDIPGGKRSNARTLELEVQQILDLYEYIQQHRPKIIANRESDLLFPTLYKGTKLHTRAILLQLQAVNPKVQDLKQLRASVIVKWLRMYSIREVQYKAGHRYISSTEAYLPNEMEGLKEEVDVYHPLN